jgi:hypothetical protein
MIAVERDGFCDQLFRIGNAKMLKRCGEYIGQMEADTSLPDLAASLTAAVTPHRPIVALEDQFMRIQYGAVEIEKQRLFSGSGIHDRS